MVMTPPTPARNAGSFAVRDGDWTSTISCAWFWKLASSMTRLMWPDSPSPSRDSGTLTWPVAMPMPMAAITNRNQSPSAVNLRRALQPPIRAARFFLVGLDDIVRILSDWIDRIPASSMARPAAVVRASVLRCGNPNAGGSDQRR